LVEQAISANYNIAAAVARIQQAKAQAFIAGTALLPTGGATFARNWNLQSGASVDSETKLPASRTWQFSLSPSYNFDFWGKQAALILAAKETTLASQFDRDVTELNVVTTLITAYFEILATQDQLRIANDNLRVATRVRDIIKQRVDAGTSTSIDLAQQDYIVVQQRATIPTLTKTLEQDVAAIAVLIGTTPDQVSIRGGGLGRLTIPVVTPGLPSELLLQRPDIREAEAALASASANLASARVALLPSISLTAQGGYESTMLKTLITPQAVFYNVAANAMQPIFDAPHLFGQIKFQRAVERELLEKYRNTIVSALSDVVRALVAIRESAREEALIRQSLAIARHGYSLSENQLSGGAIDLTTMLNIQRTLFEAQNTLAQVRLVRFDAIVSLYLALGGGWVPEPLPASEAGTPVPAAAAFEPAERN
jgi:outer membrane protein, multidrug efflux system